MRNRCIYPLLRDGLDHRYAPPKHRSATHQHGDQGGIRWLDGRGRRSWEYGVRARIQAVVRSVRYGGVQFQYCNLVRISLEPCTRFISNTEQLDSLKRRLHHWHPGRWSTCHDFRLDRSLCNHHVYCPGNGRDVLAMASGWRPILMGGYASTAPHFPTAVIYHWMVHAGRFVVVNVW